MAWENANLMFPNNLTCMGEPIDIDGLQQYDEVSMPEYRFARDMVILTRLLIWKSNGDFTKIIEYNVNNYNNKPEEDSCLSVYGNKMILDYYQRNLYILRRRRGEAQRAGFNYTGL